MDLLFFYLYLFMRSRLNNSEAVNQYNHWFITLRFYAFAALVAFLLITQFLAISFSQFQLVSLSVTSLIIIIYNFIFYFYLKKKHNVDPHIFALLQIGLDLISLFFIVYLTGGITSPFIFFFIFHIIIGSLLFPRSLIQVITFTIIILIIIFTSLEYYRYIPHQVIKGLMVLGEFRNLLTVISIILALSFTFISSLVLASKIASDLYTREEQLKNALLEIEQNEEIKQKYIAGIVHELKSPIAAANSLLELVTAGYSGDISIEAVEKIKRSEERLKEAISGINKVLRISQFKLNHEIQEDSVDIKNIVERVFDANKDLCERKQIKTDIEISDDYHSLLLGDPVLLKLAISNLIGNAIKYNVKQGRIVVELSSNEKKSIIVVSDTGIGIPKDELDNITKDYYRASNAKTSGIEGSGTGLSFVKDIVEAHSGKIKINSPSKIVNSQNKGTTIIIVLPRDK